MIDQNSAHHPRTARRRVAAVGTALALAAVVGGTVTDASPARAAASTQTVSCSAGNFTGTADVLTTTYSGGLSANVLRYKIEKRNGQSGGNKANVNVTVGNATSKSPDRMIQDGQWHNIDLVTGGGSNFGHVQFIFDKSGSDPRCDAGFWQF